MPRRQTPKKTTRKTSRPKKPIVTETPLEPLDKHAAGIDIGATSHWVAVPPEGREESVREFGVFTADLYRIAEWLQTCGVKRVAMEAMRISVKVNK